MHTSDHCILLCTIYMNDISRVMELYEISPDIPVIIISWNDKQSSELTAVFNV